MNFRLLLIHVGFALTGVVTTMLGPVLPFLANSWSLNDAQSGRLFTIQFLFSVAGALAGMRLKNRMGATKTVSLGMMTIALGVALVVIGDFRAGLAGIALYGIGLGFAIPSTNLMMSELIPGDRAAALNLLNFSWSAGALAAPMIINQLVHPIGLRGLLLLIASVCAVIAVLEVTGAKTGVAVEDAAVIVGRMGKKGRIKFAVLTALLLFFYVGLENGIAGWVPTFTQRTQAVSPSTTAMLQSSFWAAILLGRVAAPWVLHRLKPAKLVLLGLTLSTIGCFGIVFSPDVPMLALAVVACGIGLSTVFPTAVAIFTEWYGTGGGGSIVLGVPGLGGALFPWLIGVISYQTGQLRLGMSVNVAVAILMVVTFFWMIQVAMDSARARIAESSA